ncbi:MAG: 16S rRNA (uracil(1498)-N(3))-methyltransferase [Holophagaceae bacterium]|nr:16S rRNA (uracil(1498)-N(3))-methyltransferase [Holophagaceae bacterium]
MNLVLLFEEDLVAPDRARLSGRRFRHVREVHRAVAGQELKVGLLGGRHGRGRVIAMDGDALDLELAFDGEPPPKLPLTLIAALPRPKVLNRVLASATSLGAARIVLLNAWKVEKSYWKSPRLAEENLRHQCILGLEQAGDTVLPELQVARLFRPFVEDALPALAAGSRKLLAHPGVPVPCPRDLREPVTLALGPEGGWVEAEVASFLKAGFEAVSLGPRILRTETALAALAGRLL